MNQNRKRLVLFTTTAVALALLVYLALSKKPKQELPSPMPAQLALPATPTVQAKPPPTLPFAVGTEPLYQKTPAGGAVKDLETVRNAAEGFNVPINFWGRVVDQENRPLATVKVRYSVRQMAIPAAGWPDYRSDFFELTTDGDGGFRITGKKGDSLSVEALIKDGYQLGSRERRSFAYAHTPAIFTPDQQSPVVFTMIKATDPTQLKRFTARIGVPYNGTPAAIDPMTGRRGGNGRLKISCLREPPSGAAPARDYPWKLKVEFEGGGLVTVEPGATYEAPAEGYQSQLVYEMRSAGNDWKSSTRQEYYFRSAENLYGRLSVQITLRSDEPDAFVNVSGVLNLSGSRNLEPGSAQALTR